MIQQIGDQIDWTETKPMNEEERYLFDLQGYLVIPNAIEPETVTAMNAWIDTQAERDEKWRGQTGNAHIDSPILWGPLFRNLIDNPRILPCLKETLGAKLRLDHDYAIFLQPGHTGLKLHGPNTTPFDPCHYYRCYNGQIYCGLTVATYALTDTPPGTGGLAIVPGSHKSNFECPADIKRLERASSIVQQISAKAGDCILFTEALVHGTLPWQGPGVRRTLFFKYAPCSIAWSNQTYFPSGGTPGAIELESELTEAQRILLSPPGAVDFAKKL